MARSDLYRRWRRRLLVLQAKIAGLLEECRATGSEECIHDLRVAIRRARLYAQVGRALLRKDTVKRFDLWGRALNKRIGPVRDCDVCLNWLASVPQSTDAIELIHEERVRLWDRASKKLPPGRFANQGAAVFRKRGKDLERKLDSRYRRALKAITSAVENAVPRARQMSSQELHDLRRVLRRWRYLRELGLPARTQRRDPGLSWLNSAQDALGEAQNLQMSMELVRKILPASTQDRLIARALSQQARWITRARREVARLANADWAEPC